MELVFIPLGLLRSLRLLPPEAKLLKMTLLVIVVTHKGLGPRLRLRLGHWSLRWRLRLLSLGLGGLGYSLGLSLGCPWKGVMVVLKNLWLGDLDRLLGRFPGWLMKNAIFGLV